jgi:hypothetical protein
MVYDKIIDIYQLQKSPEIPLEELEFRLDKNNYRIPYWNNKRISCIKLKLSDNVYDYISSAALLPNDEIITGELIQSIADVVVGTQESLQYNPNNTIYSKEMRTIDELTILNSYKTIFVFTHNLDTFYQKFENQLSDKVIITHNSDGEIKTVKPVKFHLAQNCFITPDLMKIYTNIMPLPIGIENTQWFNHAILHHIRKMNLTKTKGTYFYFNKNTHSSRYDCYSALKDKLQWNSMRDKKDYFFELAQHKYAVCPRGNGLDTHRIWECLYLNVIPIVLKLDFPNITGLPVIVVERWEDIESATMNPVFVHQEFSKLSLSYYRKVIESHISVSVS